MLKDTLFLHMGPGLNSHVERQLLGYKYPNVNFWDQPRITAPAKAYLTLVESAEAELDKMYKSLGKPVRLMAHSFGGHLATMLLRRAPQKIEGCSFISTGFNIPAGFFNLLRVMKETPGTESALRLEIAEFLKTNSPSTETFWPAVGLIVKDSAFMRHYWPKLTQFETYNKVAATGPALDFSTFQAVMADFIANHFSEAPAPVPVNIDIQIELGQSDPLLVVDKEVQVWRHLYPHAKINIQPRAGHYIHLESFL